MLGSYMIEGPTVTTKDKEAIIAEIHEAFRDVTREGGVSWTEADLIDGGRGMADRLEGRAQDKDTRWQELVHVGHYHAWESNWSFLDAIGFRYYLPAKLIECLDDLDEVSMAYNLSLAKPKEMADYTRSMWGLLDERQSACVREFLAYASNEYAARYDDPEDNDWLEAYNSYWKDL